MMTSAHIAHAMNPRGDSPKDRRLTGFGVLAILLGAFGVIAAVNGTMVYYALSTFSGEVDPHPYEHGLAYNKDIAAAVAQEARHWQVSAHVTANGAMKTVEAAFRDEAAHPISGLHVTARLEFATDMIHDRNVTLSETAPGSYSGVLPLAAGNWDLVLNAEREGKQLFVSRNRLMVP